MQKYIEPLIVLQDRETRMGACAMKDTLLNET